MKIRCLGILILVAAMTALYADGSLSVSANRGLSDRMAAVVDGTYQSLAKRVRPSGYAGTSVTGAYPGMFARDASIQAMVMQEAGNAEASRAMLEYLINYGTVAGLKRAPHYAPDEDYVEAASIPVKSGRAEDPAAFFDEPDRALFRIKGPNNGTAQTFVAPASPVTKVSLALLAVSNSPGDVTVTIRRSHDWSAPILASARASSTAAFDKGGRPVWVDFFFPSPVPLAAGQEYDILAQSSAAVVQAWGRENAATLRQRAINYDREAMNGWVETRSQIAFRVFTERGATASPRVKNGPGFPDKPPVRLASVGGGAAVKQAFSTKAVVSGVDLFLARGEGAAGDVAVAVSDSTGRTSTARAAAGGLSAEGGWVRFTFPTVGIGGDGSYAVTVSSPESSENSVRVFGVEPAGVGHASRAVRMQGVETTALDGSLGLQALSLVYSGEDMVDQPDGNYMFVLAWARYVGAHPGDTQFVKDTYPTIAAWADYYLNDAYLHPVLDLLYNPQLEHSRRAWHIPAYDLITNVFVAQALRELAAIAAKLPGQSDLAERWGRLAIRLDAGIDKNLTSTVEGKKIYAELYWVDGGKDGSRTKCDGYSWVSLAPVAARWDGIDWKVMENTYDAYLKHGAIEWTNAKDDHSDLMLMMDTEEDTWEPQGNGVDYWDRYAVIGKGLGWEYSLAGRLKRVNRLATMSHFVEVQTPGDVLGEFYYKQGPSDVGNQEQGSWWLLGVMDAYPARSAK